MKTERKNEHYLALQQAFDAPWPGPVGELVMLEKGNIHLQIYPHDGARITSLKAFGSEVLRQWQPQRRAFQYGCFPMVPWAGRLGNATLNAGGQCYSLPANKPPHALHGMACYSTWEIIDKTADSLTLRMPLASPWPWQGEVIQTFFAGERCAGFATGSPFICRYIPGLRRLASVVCEKADSAKYRIVAGAF